MNKSIYKGFTLVELLVVIAVAAVLLAGVMTVINPREKLLQAQDSQGQNGIAQLSGALNAYAVLNGGIYPQAGPPDDGLNALVTGEELTALPAPPSGSGGWLYSVNLSRTNSCVSVSMQAARNQPSTCGGGAALCTHWAWCNTWGVAMLNDGQAIAP